MVGIVIVSHSAKVAEGTRELALQMAPDYENLIAAGGLEGGEIGTDPARIMEAIQEADQGQGVAVLVDIGSGIMSAETAIEFLEGQVEARIADAPIVEGAIVAAVEASAGEPLEAVIAAAEASWEDRKL